MQFRPKKDVGYLAFASFLFEQKDAKEKVCEGGQAGKFTSYHVLHRVKHKSGEGSALSSNNALVSEDPVDMLHLRRAP